MADKSTPHSTATIQKTGFRKNGRGTSVCLVDLELERELELESTESLEKTGKTEKSESKSKSETPTAESK